MKGCISDGFLFDHQRIIERSSSIQRSWIYVNMDVFVLKFDVSLTSEFEELSNFSNTIHESYE